MLHIVVATSVVAPACNYMHVQLVFDVCEVLKVNILINNFVNFMKTMFQNALAWFSADEELE